MIITSAEISATSGPPAPAPPSLLMLRTYESRLYSVIGRIVVSLALFLQA